MARDWKPITKVKRQKLARQLANEAYGKQSSYHVGQAGKVIDNLLSLYPNKFLEFHDKYCTPIDEDIIAAGKEWIAEEATKKELAKKGAVQMTLFD